ncbi:maleylpyruvate isomerase family mycothiol-dependent enzyme [Streptomyces boncukensis]|uniref:Maleylpyruvate isomerase family mycothiol-dependent enzyme n=1 Tax=Streptomyces boncukensis TaxID=2711219 RepID=A0A6G4WSZ8_9ACTN|nr:maleylpyruvate isomerase family mycothiol-dependent enzyme [Streptomyces boncukensis]NGO68396.1 maleylpyruvate isomerase family mycothiol-dependent enzyme [Streptomyces boncukensis]
MTSPAHDVELLRTATDRLLSAAGALDPAAVTEPSLLPGWTRGHVLAHVARNADALINVLDGRPMYAGAEVRDGDIERDAPRPLAVQLDDFRTSAERLDTRFAAETAWDRTVELRNGVRDTAGSVPFRRWIEVELHHVDLGIGYGLADLPGAFVDRELANMARRFSGHAQVPEAVELRVEDGRVLRTGAAEGEPVVVAGSATALVGWLTGRTSGSGLSARGPLPELPSL